ncbi:nuclease-related domain-containing protein [Halobacillus campisalis]|uniref:Nuclease-related domain-containing protein n=1 Tax=Halobacillus campisalis TaxID=435909 RepID=A0ABW2K2D1_9BACI|nr:nuclease-related domain-containing protein [Halobacillus campisalis]
MAQLIKLFDYISRYETDMYQYPSKYIRLKQNNWVKMKELWEKGEFKTTENEPEEQDERKKSKWSWRFKRNKPAISEDYTEEEGWIPENEQNLKQYFLDELFPFQIKWASTTIFKKSFIDQNLLKDSHLKLLLQRLPDHYFVMYKPVVELKNAPMEAEILLIGPYEIEIVKVIEEKADRLHSDAHNQWYIESEEVQSRYKNPLLGLKRTETFLRSVIKKYGLSCTFKHVLLAPYSTITAVREPYLTTFVDEHSLEAWLQQKRKLTTPLKHDQLRAAEKLLQHTKTVAMKRPEWDVDPEETL